MSADFSIQLLSKLPFFAGFEPDALELIAFSGDRVRFSRGETIFEAGQTSEGGHLVLEGRVELFRPGSLHAPVQIIAPGGLIGELALITATERPVWAIAGTDCMTLKITRGAVRRVLQEFPEGAEALRRTLAVRVKSMLNELTPAESPTHRSAV